MNSEKGKKKTLTKMLNIRVRIQEASIPIILIWCNELIKAITYEVWKEGTSHCILEKD